PGAGKTHLVRAVAPEAVHCVVGEAGLAAAVAEALGVPSDVEGSWIDATAQAARARGAPVVLDDIGSRDDEVALWLARDPGVPVVLVGRSRPSRPEGTVIHLEGLDGEAAVALLAERAPDAAPRDLRTLAERLEGLPLALELAAARLAVITVPELLDRLEDPLSALAHAPAHLRSLEAVALEAWQRLSPAEQRVLALVAALDPGPDLPMLEAVEPDALDALQTLVEGSLVRRLAPCGGRARFRAVVGVRELAVAEAPEAHVLAAALEPRARAELAAWRTSADAVARLRRDAALYRRLATADTPALLVASVRARHDYLPWRAALERIETARAVADLAALRVLRAEVLRHGDHFEEAEAELQAVDPDESLELLGGNPVTLVRGHVALRAKQVDEARALGASLDSGAGDAVVAGALTLLGAIDAARVAWEAAIDRLEREGDEAGLAWSLTPFAALEEWAGHPERSVALFERAVDICTRRGLRTRQLLAKQGRAYARLDAGHTAEALEVAHRLGEEARASGLSSREIEADMLRADALDDRGDVDAAGALRRRLLPRARARQRSSVGLLRIALEEPLADDEREAQTGWVRALADAVVA
ncbi:MAG: hypothetical protein R3263_11390, partial [Myxococcota bacterium]|nr:hypothetical protein [Myxococcota bacterium]